MIWKFIKIPKAVALLAFFLPWMTVSCSSQKVAEGTGWQLTLGQLHATIASADTSSSAVHLNYYLVAAFALIAIGLVLTILPRAMPKTLMATTVAAFLLIWTGTSRYTPEALAAAARKKDGNNIDEIATSMIKVDWQWGYWATIVALGLVLVMAWMAMNESRAGRPPG